MKNRVLLGVMALAMAALSSCGLASAKINESCLVYSGGIVEDAEFIRVMKPGANADNIGMGSNTYCYRNDQRSYIAGAGEKGDTDAVVGVSKDNVRVRVQYQLYFTLNQEEEILQEFHENLGVKTEAWTDEGWRQLLIEFFEPQIERAIESAALNYNWRDLYSSEEARREFQKSVVEGVRRNLREIIGNDYFCGPDYTKPGDECGDFTFTVGKPEPVNDEIIKAVESEQKAAAESAAQEQKNAQIELEAKGKQQLVDLYGPQGALLYEAIQGGQVQIMVVPSDGSVALPLPTHGKE